MPKLQSSGSGFELAECRPYGRTLDGAAVERGALQGLLGYVWPLLGRQPPISADGLCVEGRWLYFAE